jgi:hypothetical protein
MRVIIVFAIFLACFSVSATFLGAAAIRTEHKPIVEAIAISTLFGALVLMRDMLKIRFKKWF